MSEASHSSAPVVDSAPADPAILEKALAGQKDAYLRLAADFDNFRKRTRRDTAQQAAAEKESFIRELLPILDNLERALACEESTAPGQLHRGVEMIRQQLAGLLQRHGIEPAEDLGQPFDPQLHEAVAVGHDGSQPDHVILKVIQRGYRRGEQVFRPAMVVVNEPGHSSGGGRAS